MTDLSKILPPAIRSNMVEGVNGLSVHVLESGGDQGIRPCLLLLHGFPELAFSWRHLMVPLADAGYRVIAPDLRGYGRTTGWGDAYDVDLTPWTFEHLISDLVELVSRLGIDRVASVIGHDFGSPLAGWCTLARPDIFRSVVLMSAPFAGVAANAPDRRGADLNIELEQLSPARQHYQHYFSSPAAASDMAGAPDEVAGFLHAYFYAKSAAWPGNQPHPLEEMTALSVARLPTYYVMHLDETMPATVAAYRSEDGPPSCPWLTYEALMVYGQEYSRTCFQGGLNWYRARLQGIGTAFAQRFAGRKVERPGHYIAGTSDWGMYQTPGVFQAMPLAFGDWRGTSLVDQAGHWVQQEQPEQVILALKKFLSGLSDG